VLSPFDHIVPPVLMPGSFFNSSTPVSNQTSFVQTSTPHTSSTIAIPQQRPNATGTFGIFNPSNNMVRSTSLRQPTKSAIFTTQTPPPPSKGSSRKKTQLSKFLTSLYRMVNQASSDKYIRWGESGQSFVVPDHDAFAAYCLPQMFKHQNWSSFVRQLNMYDFHKVARMNSGALIAPAEVCEYANKNFQRGRPERLSDIQRKHKHESEDQGEEIQRTVMEGIAREIGEICRSQQFIKEEIDKMKQEQMMVRLWMKRTSARNDLKEREIRQVVDMLGKDGRHETVGNVVPRGYVEGASSSGSVYETPRLQPVDNVSFGVNTAAELNRQTATQTISSTQIYLSPLPAPATIPTKNLSTGISNGYTITTPATPNPSRTSYYPGDSARAFYTPQMSASLSMTPIAPEMVRPQPVLNTCFDGTPSVHANPVGYPMSPAPSRSGNFPTNTLMNNSTNTADGNYMHLSSADPDLAQDRYEQIMDIFKYEQAAEVDHTMGREFPTGQTLMGNVSSF
jgi:HSF-type DNA-binding